MSRNTLIALGGSLAVVLLVFWLVTRMFPEPPDPVLGKWRTKDSAACDNAATYFIVTQDAIALQGQGKPPEKIMSISAIEHDGDTHRLRIFLPDKAPDFDLDAPYQVVGDTLTFGPVDWTPQAKQKYADFLQSFQAAVTTADNSIGFILQTYQPFQRCPG